jgi:hypothetical protein
MNSFVTSIKQFPIIKNVETNNLFNFFSVQRIRRTFHKGMYVYFCNFNIYWHQILVHIFILVYAYKGESNGNLPLRICPGCSVPEPYQSPDWALVPALPA